jgi:UDP-N-acetyl-D-mannosaminuronate dehydrogenase
MRVSVIGMGKRGAALTYRIYKAGFEVHGQEIVHFTGENKNCPIAQECLDTGSSDVIIIGGPSDKGTCFLYQILDRIIIKQGALLSIETTVLPGTADFVCRRLSARELKAGDHYHLVHVPYFQGAHGFAKENATRVIGGVTAVCLARGMDFYARLMEQLFPVPDIKIAEMVPLIESAHRFLHISFAQEIKEFCDENQLSFHTLRTAVNVAGHTLPEVGAGVGENLPRDMAFLQSFCPSPLFTGALAADVRYRTGLSTRVKTGQKVLVIGLVDKGEDLNPLVNPTMQLISDLEQKGCFVYVQDDHISPIDLAAFGLCPPDPQVTYDVIINRGEIYRARED